MPYGYLGVDIFFVVGGYLLISSLKRQMEKGVFNYWKFLFRKIVRLWPLVILVSVVAVGIGFFLMLPDDYENLAESVIASSAFVNNILQCITTKNYWDVVNLYKPLMHLWYIGVLMQAYIVLPLIYMLLSKVNRKRGIAIGTASITIFSSILFLLPTFSSAWKFYYLPFRAFEITAGGLLVEWEPKAGIKAKKITAWISFVLLLVLITTRTEIVSGSAMLLFTVVFSLAFLWATKELSYNGIKEKAIDIGAAIGKRSYSIYIWHQVIVAFMFYSFFPKQNSLTFVVFVAQTALISLLSYKIENLLSSLIGKKTQETAVIAVTIVVAVAVCSFSFLVYRHAGVVRDVPELNVYKENVHRGMHAEYCDRPYSWDREFENDGRKKVLVIGNSFGRDWANILYEWDHEKKVEISYLFFAEDAIEKHIKRIEEADIVFYAMGPGYGEIQQSITETTDSKKLYIVGNKNYGESNGIIYAKRFSEDYYDQTVEIPIKLTACNMRDSSQYADRYIDMMTPVMVDNTHVRVFTDDNMFISQDCRHLTQAGAQYYARILDVGRILGIEH